MVCLNAQSNTKNKKQKESVNDRLKDSNLWTHQVRMQLIGSSLLKLDVDENE